ncbi:MAG: metallophosphoesterase family protein [bacterium]|nr:metallophosphoesterase family protein [bacterium]
MRIAVLADIHGNATAFEAVLNALPSLGVDRVVILGDVVTGAPDSLTCWELAQSLKCPMVRGNHEAYVSEFGTADHDPEWDGDRFGPLRWTVNQLSAIDIQLIRDLPTAYRFSDFPELLFVHASLRSDRDTVLAYTPVAEVASMFPDVAAKWILRGHNHVCGARFWEDRVIVTSGSIGLPMDGRTTAQFLVLDKRLDGWQVQHHAIAYEVEAALARFRATGYLDAAGPMARLYMREVATAGSVLMSFMSLYQSWASKEAISLGAAVDRYFTLC